MSEAKWWCRAVFNYRHDPNDRQWTVFDGEGDSDIAVIAKDEATARTVCMYGNLWNPLGRLAAWMARMEND